MKRKAETDWKVPYVSILQAVCGGGHCAEYADDQGKESMLIDDQHFSDAGAQYVVKKLVDSCELPDQLRCLTVAVNQ